MWFNDFFKCGLCVFISDHLYIILLKKKHFMFKSKKSLCSVLIQNLN